MELTSSNPVHVRKWLAQHHPKQLTLLSQFEMELRLGRLSTSSTFSARNMSSAQSVDPNSGKSRENNFRDGCVSNIGGQDRRLVTKRTVELLRTLIGATKWKTASQLLMLLRGLGRELYSAGGFREPAIGNVVRRVMCAVRDEVLAMPTPVDSSSSSNNKINNKNVEEEDDELKELGSRFASKVSFKDGTRTSNTTASGTSSGGGRNLSLSTMLWAHTQHVKSSSTKAAERERHYERFGRKMRSDSVTSSNSRHSTHSTTNNRHTEDDEYEHDDEHSDDDDEYEMELPPSFFVMRPELKERVMEAIQETVSELDDLHKNINDQAINHIHAGEIILCYGRSKTIDYFLKAAAAKSRSFHVIIAEGAPHFSGHAMAKSLAEANIPTTIIHDAATFAIMARVNKVLLPAHAVLANGGLVAPSGCHMVALAAKENSIPVVCVTGMFKLCPMFPHEGQDTLNDLVSPSSVMEYGEVTSMMESNGGSYNIHLGEDEKKCNMMEEVELVNPVHDYIPPDLIKLYVTNIGGFQPSYIYKLLAEYYHTDDWESFE